MYMNLHILKWIRVKISLNSTSIYFNIYRLRWMHVHPNKTLRFLSIHHMMRSLKPLKFVYLHHSCDELNQCKLKMMNMVIL